MSFTFRNIGGGSVLPDPTDTTFKDEGRPQKELVVQKGQTFTYPTDLRKSYEGKFELIGETGESDSPFASWKPDGETTPPNALHEMGPGESMGEQPAPEHPKTHAPKAKKPA